jgi:hypothetical protein
MATYTKLKSGNWGIRSMTAVTEGDSVAVTKRDGGQKVEIVDKVVWSGDGVWVAAVRKSDAPSPPSPSPRKPRAGRARGTFECGECGECGEFVVRWETGCTH